MSTLTAPLQLPRVQHYPPAQQNSSDEVTDLCSAYGLDLLEWQRYVLCGSLGERPDGQWVTPRVGISVPRQCGKGGILEARQLAGLLLFGERLIISSSHEVKTALDGFRRVRSYFENYDDLRRLVRRISQTNGQEAIELLSGQALRFMARSKSSGRGFSADCLILDEAQELSEDTWAAMLPTTSARPNPQIWLAGTPPSNRMNGEVFSRFREGGIVGDDPRLCWMEWSAGAEDDLDDPDTWRKANPSLDSGIVPLTVEKIADERASMDDSTFARERLGMWSTGTHSRVIDQHVWADLADLHSRPGDQIAFGVEVSPDEQFASIGTASWRPDGKRHLEVIENHHTGEEFAHHPLLGGMTVTSPDWVVPVAAAIAKANRDATFYIEQASPAAVMIQPLRTAGVNVRLISPRDVAAAAGRVKNEAVDGSLVHLDQPSLNFALSVARKKAYGTEGLWTWHRRSADSDITPLGSVTLAVHGLSAAKVRTNRAAFF